MKKGFSLIVAATEKNGIGLKNDLPWRLKKDMNYFTKVTSLSSDSFQNAVIMGRKTWESIPLKYRPLSGRLNIVLSKNKNSRDEYNIPPGVLVAQSLNDALEELNSDKFTNFVDKVFVIGGSAVYSEAIESPLCKELFITRIYKDFDCDTFFPTFSSKVYSISEVSPLQTENGIKYQFIRYIRNEEKEEDYLKLESYLPVAAPQHEEMQYINIIKHILKNGKLRGDRTGTGTVSLFGVTMRYSLRNNTLPLLTTKRVFWRGVAEELLWFISGDTNAKTLQNKDIHIWDGNGSREYLDSIGLKDRETGDLGPVYGFQWRHFGAEYSTMHENYEGKGVDQLASVIKKLKENPNDRRIILSAWNPKDMPLMALPPCHMFAQFYVSEGELHCQMYQRSADMGLGVPFNIASYALLTHLLAKCTGLKAGEFIHVIGDAHIYANHIEPLKLQLEREPYPFPTLKINTDNVDIDKFNFSDFEVENYKCHASIKMAMAV